MAIVVFHQVKVGAEKKGTDGEFNFDYQGFGVANSDGTAPSGEGVTSTGDSFTIATVEEACEKLGVSLDAVLAAAVTAANTKARNAAAAPFRLESKLKNASEQKKEAAEQNALATLKAVNPELYAAIMATKK